MATLSQSGFGAGRLYSSIGNLGMTICGNDLAGSYYLTASLAASVAGIAVFGTSCVMFIADFLFGVFAGFVSAPLAL